MNALEATSIVFMLIIVYLLYLKTKIHYRHQKVKMMHAELQRIEIEVIAIQGHIDEIMSSAKKLDEMSPSIVAEYIEASLKDLGNSFELLTNKKIEYNKIRDKALGV